MRKVFYETIFNVTKSYQDGKCRTSNKSVYSEVFKDGKNNTRAQRIENGTKALQTEGYEDIVFIMDGKCYMTFEI